MIVYDYDVRPQEDPMLPALPCSAKPLFWEDGSGEPAAML